MVQERSEDWGSQYCSWRWPRCSVVNGCYMWR